MKNTLIVANGDLNDGLAVRHALTQADLRIAADGGADVARRLLAAAGLPYHVDVVIGDMDSVLPATLETLQAQGADILRFPHEKNETDLELALLEAVKRGASVIRVVAAMGNRLDQTLANVYLLNIAPLQGLDAKLVSGSQTAWLLSAGEHALMGAPGDTLSLLPLSGSAEGITTEDLKYPLRGETLYFGPARGVSNVVSGANPRLHFTAGLLLAVHTIGRA